MSFRDGDGVDTVFHFDVARDCVRIAAVEALSARVVVEAVHGVGMPIERGGDRDAILSVGVDDPAAIRFLAFGTVTEARDGGPVLAGVVLPGSPQSGAERRS